METTVPYLLSLSYSFGHLSFRGSIMCPNMTTKPAHIRYLNQSLAGEKISFTETGVLMQNCTLKMQIIEVPKIGIPTEGGTWLFNPFP